MATNYNDIVLYGFSNIQIKGENEVIYKPLLGGISIQVNISTETVSASNKTTKYTFFGKSTAEGQLTLLELSLVDKAKLFGNKIIESENGFYNVTVRDTDTPPNFSLKFEREKANGKKVVYEILSVTFLPNSIQANTTTENGIEEENITIDFIINEKDGILYRMYEN